MATPSRNRSGTSAQSFFDRHATTYDAAYDSRGSAGRELRRREGAVVSRLGPGPGSVVDAGMGAGRLLNRLQADGWSATGVDAAHGMVVLAEHRLAGGGGAVVQGRIEALPLRSGTYDAAVASGVLEYVDDLTTALQELARVVRTSGDVVVTMPNAAALPLVWAHYVWYPLVRAVKRLLPVGRPAPPPAPGPVTLRRLRALLKARALLCTDVQYVGLRPFPAPLPDLMPRVAGRLARWLEPRMRIGRRLLATQIVVSTIRVR